MQDHSFSVYNASAGSGKTFTLVKEYLKILFEAPFNDKFKQILAITFTNKAVGEMKERILETLKQFKDPKILTTQNSMFKAIVEELSLKPEFIHNKSKVLLNTIMHNYAAFDISTIDGFNHKLIRTFAHDLKIPINFEVELDALSLISEAVDSLIAKAGSDERLTKILIDFAVEKADDDKSWDIARDLNTIAKLLINENDLDFINTIEDKTLDDFEALKVNITNKLKTQEKSITQNANKAIELFLQNNLTADDFLRGTLYNHFKKASESNIKDLYNNKLAENIAEGKVYKASLDNDRKQTIDSLLPQIESLYHNTKQAVYSFKFLKAFYKNITPLSVLNLINKELNVIKSEENKMLISEFNAIISEEIAEQPTPFIYERLGEKFRHYFIDEFQDTSKMQWGNLIPLIDNTLSGQNLKGEQGTAMLVGDAKQAIYRWRGGKAEQFIDLFNGGNPFQVPIHVENLKFNYRSYQNIIEFNNGFFEYLSATAFGNATYANLYKLAQQELFIEEKGYVNINFIDYKKDDDKDEVYPQYVLDTISSTLDNGFSLKDICILVRKKKEGIAIADFLSNNGVKITSSETMLIASATEVKVLQSILKILINPKDDESKLMLLDYLSTKYNIEDQHSFFTNHLKLNNNHFFESFKQFNINVNPENLVQLSLFDMVESLVRDFKLIEDSNAYVQFYLDAVLEYSQKNSSEITGFLEYFGKKEETLSIVSPQNQNAVQIMTIHKSKGLEFPVVIFPYAELDIYREKEPKEWYKINPEHYNGFTNTLINYNKDFESFDTVGQAIHQKHQAELELDNINLLYVALTRAVEQLYIIGKKDITSKGVVNSKTYSGLLVNYIKHKTLWNDSQLEYRFGSPKREKLPKKMPQDTIEQNQFISVAKQDHNINIIANSGYLWDTEQENALEKGNLVHDIMAHIRTVNDVAFVINDYLSKGTINQEQAQNLNHLVHQIIQHPELKDYYTNKNTIYNERDIISKNKKLLRPDRLVITPQNNAIIIDYKTGLHNPKYQQQLQDYQDVLQDMGYNVTKKILLYINKDIKIIQY